ncbi:LysR substrate-binding domain-containing protein [Streptomyces carpinensis]|uniref:LysR substrate-binding domain-containing protein n=1 Tax=Streptomyces carpinensis TaxID=66369 RepID=A0ABV1WDQ4_9ACTN|nr:LysR substrate-binding domain-containing protein [Streptomyces carpinensis]
MTSKKVDRLLDGRFKLRHLTLVTTIAEHGSLVGAAQALHVTQPVVTRGLREAEEVLGVSLFQRGPRGVKPTVYGELLIENARAILGNLRRVGEHIDQIQRVGDRPVRVGTNLAGAYTLLPRAVIALKQERPMTAVAVLEGTPDELVKQLHRNEVDLLVGRLTPEESGVGLRQLRLYDEPVRIVARRGHPALTLPTPTIEALVDFPWVLPTRPALLRDEIDELFAERDLDPPSNLIECTTILTIRAILAGTDAVAVLPAMIGAGDDTLDVLPIVLETVPLSIGITWRADEPLSDSAQLLLGKLRRVAREIAAEMPTPYRSRP